MSNKLTLKEKIELFKLSKKPRKQIRLRFDALNMDLNFPTVGQSTHIKYKNFEIKKQMPMNSSKSQKALTKPKYKT